VLSVGVWCAHSTPVFFLWCVAAVLLFLSSFSRFLCQRAEDFIILRRAPTPGYSLSFLITNFHAEDMKKAELVNFIIQFMQDVNAEVSELKLAVNSRARVVAHTFLKQFC
jgi:actin related protein 2/3 complex subunit 4